MRRRLLLLADDLGRWASTGGLFSTPGLSSILRLSSTLLREYWRNTADENRPEHDVPDALQELPRHEKTSLLFGYSITVDTGGHHKKKRPSGPDLGPKGRHCPLTMNRAADQDPFVLHTVGT